MCIVCADYIFTVCSLSTLLFEVTDLSDIDRVCGRILRTGQEEEMERSEIRIKIPVELY